MNILFCQPTLERSGSEHSLLEILLGLREASDFSQRVLAGKDGPMRSAVENAAGRLEVIPAPKLTRRLSSWPGFIRSFFSVAAAIRRIKNRDGLSVVYVNTLMFPQAVIGAWLCRLKTIVHVREVQDRYPGPAYRLYMGLATLLADRIVCVCEYIRDQHRLPWRERFMQRSVVIYNSSGFEVEPIRRAVSNRLNILGVVPLTERKGAWELLRFVSILSIRSAHLPGFKFNLKIAGPSDDASFKERYRGHIEKLGLTDRVTLLGPQADLEPLYRQAHLVVHPSRFEAFPRILVEAANFSLPVVATDAGGSAEAVIEGETGFIVPVGDPGRLAGRVLQLVEDPELYRRLSEGAYKRYREIFHRRHAGDKLYRLLTGVKIREDLK